MGKRSGIGAKKEQKTFDPFEIMDNFGSLDPLALFENQDCLQSGEKDDEENELEALIYRERKPTKREFKAIKSNEYLQQALAGLPTTGETWHCISNSRFNFWSFVPCVIKFLGDYTSSLYCATWTTNNINTKELIELYDQGKIGSINFVVGRYFQNREQAVYNYLAGKLLERGQKLSVGEHHLKVLLLNNGENFITIESSANLTSNPRTEQFTYSNDKGLFDFYKSWFESLA